MELPGRLITDAGSPGDKETLNNWGGMRCEGKKGPRKAIPRPVFCIPVLRVIVSWDIHSFWEEVKDPVCDVKSLGQRGTQIPGMSQDLASKD